MSVDKRSLTEMVENIRRLRDRLQHIMSMSDPSYFRGAPHSYYKRADMMKDELVRKIEDVDCEIDEMTENLDDPKWLVLREIQLMTRDALMKRDEAFTYPLDIDESLLEKERINMIEMGYILERLAILGYDKIEDAIVDLYD